MLKFVPYSKLSKRKRREHNIAKRGSWGGLNPVTKKPANPKAYSRTKQKVHDGDFSAEYKERSLS
jgi:hypothetical protein